MGRFGLIVIGGLLGVSLLGAQDSGRSERLWRWYLSETVKRGLPLLANDPNSGVVPFWPELDRFRTEANSLEPGPDTDLVSAWIDLREANATSALSTLQARWPRPDTVRFLPRLWAEALFAAWNPADDPRAWTNAWLAWEGKAYAPRVLVRGLESLEKQDPSAVVPLLNQARRLYPDDRRFLSLILRHPESGAPSVALVRRDLALNGGWSDAGLKALLDRQPEANGGLVEAGYPQVRLASVLGHDYGFWLTQANPPPPDDGTWFWDADHDGRSEGRITFAGGRPVTWSRASADGGLWSLNFRDGKPESVVETRGGTSWTLVYEAYPFVKTLAYRWENQTLLYRFLPLEVAMDLWPAERLSGSPARWPATLSELWLPLNPHWLATQAASIETWVGPVRAQAVLLFQGQVWMEVEDTNRDGRDDTWSYFRSGNLVSVYRDVGGQGDASLRELYQKGQLGQVQSRLPQGPRPEFVLFPAEGVQLWDPHGQSRPLDRIFQWSGGDKLDAVVFTGSTLPWETMPPWEPRP